MWVCRSLSGSSSEEWGLPHADELLMTNYSQRLDTDGLPVLKFTSLWSSVDWRNFQHASNYWFMWAQTRFSYSASEGAFDSVSLSEMNEPFLSKSVIITIMLITSFFFFFSLFCLFPTEHFFLIIQLSPSLPSSHLSPLPIHTIQSLLNAAKSYSVPLYPVVFTYVFLKSFFFFAVREKVVFID